MLEPTNNGFRVVGVVNFSNVADVRRAGEQWMKEHASSNPFTIDLSEMKDQDASSLALLLGWQRTAQKNKMSFFLERVPVSIQRMGSMFGLSSVIFNG